MNEPLNGYPLLDGTMLTHAPVGEQVQHMKIPALPGVRFEWHPRAKIVYFIQIGATPEIGNPVAHDIADPQSAKMAALIWARGFVEGSVKIIGEPT